MRKLRLILLLVVLLVPTAAHAQTPEPPTPTPMFCPPGMADFCEWGVNAKNSYGWLGLVLALVLGGVIFWTVSYVKEALGAWNKDNVFNQKLSGEFKRAGKRYLENANAHYSKHKFQTTTYQDRGGADLTLDDVYIEVFLSSPNLEEKDSPRKGKEADGDIRLERLESAQPVTLTKALQKLKKKKLAIEGKAGSGKSTLLQWAFITCARSNLGAKLTPEQAAFVKVFGFKKAPFPIFIPLRAYNHDCTRKKITRTADSLLQFAADYLCEQFQHIDRVLGRNFIEKILKQPCILMFDGMDEVDFRDVPMVAGAVEQMILNCEPQNQNLYALITARPTPKASEAIARMSGFEHLKVENINSEQRDKIIRRWFLRKLGGDEIEARRQADSLIARIDSAPAQVQKMAVTPLMTTVFCDVGSRRPLPQMRAELYKEMVAVLVEEARFKNDDAGKELQESFGGFSKTMRFSLMAMIAFEMQQRAVNSMFADELADLISKNYEGEEKFTKQRANEFLAAVQERGGLLESMQNGEYGFLTHDTLREYLAGQYLADEKESEWGAILSKRVFDDNWMETIRLTAGYLSIGGKQAKPNEFIRQIMSLGESAEQRARATYVAALAMSDMDKDSRKGETLKRLYEQIIPLLFEESSMSPDVKFRYNLGIALAEIGDPRFAEDKELKAIPPSWADIPAGDFMMGTSDEDEKMIKEQGAKAWDNEKPAHKVVLSAYRIGKYPVTNAEFRCFVEAGGYRKENWKRWWSPDGRGWLQGENSEFRHVSDEDMRRRLVEWAKSKSRERPQFWDDPKWSAANLPVVGVTWYEAEAYCNWLTEVLRRGGILAENQIIRLPTEAEWERAARGPKNFIWAWGNTWDASKANTDDKDGARLNVTSPVGMYPLGASGYGAMDMIGNVWEWCLDWYNEKEYKERAGKEVKDPCGKDGGDARVLRGGSWNDFRNYARCSSRLRDDPVNFDLNAGFRVVCSPSSPLRSESL